MADQAGTPRCCQLEVWNSLHENGATVMQTRPTARPPHSERVAFRMHRLESERAAFRIRKPRLRTTTRLESPNRHALRDDFRSEAELAREIEREGRLIEAQRVAKGAR